MMPEYPKPSFSRFQFEEIEHTADLALRVRGKDLKALMKNAALAMASILCDEKSLSGTDIEETVSIEADDPEELLVSWLSELVFWVEVKSFVFQYFDCDTISDTYFKATVYGKIAEELKVHIKAVTYHNLKIVETRDGLEATVVFDI